MTGTFIWTGVETASLCQKVPRIRPLVLLVMVVWKMKIYKEEGEEGEVWHGDSSSLRQGPLNFNFSLILKLTICQFNVITLQGIARGLKLTKLNREGCMRCMHQQLEMLGTVAAFDERQNNWDLENGLIYRCTFNFMFQFPCIITLYYIKNQLDAALAVLFISHCKITLHVSGAFCVHHQEY